MTEKDIPEWGEFETWDDGLHLDDFDESCKRGPTVRGCDRPRCKATNSKSKQCELPVLWDLTTNTAESDYCGQHYFLRKTDGYVETPDEVDTTRKGMGGARTEEGRERSNESVRDRWTRYRQSVREKDTVTQRYLLGRSRYTAMMLRKKRQKDGK